MSLVTNRQTYSMTFSFVIGIFSGMFALVTRGFLNNYIVQTKYTPYFIGPIIEEVSKFIWVYLLIFLSRKCFNFHRFTSAYGQGLCFGGLEWIWLYRKTWFLSRIIAILMHIVDGFYNTTSVKEIRSKNFKDGGAYLLASILLHMLWNMFALIIAHYIPVFRY